MQLNHEAEIAACNRIFSLAIPESRNPNRSDFSASRSEVARITADAKAKIAAKSK